MQNFSWAGRCQVGGLAECLTVTINVFWDVYKPQCCFSVWWSAVDTWVNILDLLQFVAAGVDNTEVFRSSKLICQIKRCSLSTRVVFSLQNKMSQRDKNRVQYKLRNVVHILALLLMSVKAWSSQSSYIFTFHSLYKSIISKPIHIFTSPFPNFSLKEVLKDTNSASY